MIRAFGTEYMPRSFTGDCIGRFTNQDNATIPNGPRDEEDPMSKDRGRWAHCPNHKTRVAKLEAGKGLEPTAWSMPNAEVCFGEEETRRAQKQQHHGSRGTTVMVHWCTEIEKANSA